ncbi:hypothetical protein OC835_001194 [Tilletia horrida]|nr:hypothetical protein OC835_001194 [Tilletia horrida]
MASAPAKALTTLFQDSALDIELDGAIERTGRAFFDQILVPTLVLRLPVAPKLLPPPATSSEAPAFLLPIRTPFPGSSPDAFNSEPSAAFPASASASEYAHDHDDEDESAQGGLDGDRGRARPSVPRLLRTLLSLIRVQVDGTYAVSRAAAVRLNPTSTTPVPSVRATDKQLAKGENGAAATAAAAADQRPSALVPFHSQSWAGNKNGRPVAGANARASSSAKKEVNEEEERGKITFESGAGGDVPGGRWVLALLFDLPVAADVFVGDQDLLSALSEGPVYPGESPSDRAQRTKSSLARLPLSQLSAQVIGTKLLTPETAAQEIKGRSNRSSVLPPLPDAATEDSNDSFDGDLSAAAGMGRRPPLLGSGSSAAAGSLKGADLSVDATAAGSSAAFSRERRVLKRSCLRVLDVSSAVSVRLRTVLSPAKPWASTLKAQNPKPANDAEDDEDALEPCEDAHDAISLRHDDSRLESYPIDEGGALLLCVELDHPLLPVNLRRGPANDRPFGELSFEITNVKIDVLEPSPQFALDADANGSVVHAVKPAVNETLCATLFDPEQALSSVDAAATENKGFFPFVLTEGQQRNLVYCVDFIDPVPAPDAIGSGSRPPSMTLHPDLGQIRQVNIVVEARPLLSKVGLKPYDVSGGQEKPKPEDAQEDGEVERLPSFSSAWNCSVDIATARTNLRRRNEAQRRTKEQRERLQRDEHVALCVATPVPLPQ